MERLACSKHHARCGELGHEGARDRGSSQQLGGDGVRGEESGKASWRRRCHLCRALIWEEGAQEVPFSQRAQQVQSRTVWPAECVGETRKFNRDSLSQKQPCSGRIRGGPS